MSFKLYSIIVSSSLGETIKEVTEIMDIPSSKYSEDLTLEKQTRAETYYPNRSVTSSIATSSFTSFGLYKLTDAEAASIKNDPLISSVRLISTQSIDIDSQIGTGSIYLETSSVSNDIPADIRRPLLSTIPNRNFRIKPFPAFTTDIDTSTLSNTATYYHSLPINKMYSGSTLLPHEDAHGRETSRTLGLNPDSQDFGESQTTFQPQGLQAFTDIHDYNYSVDGKNVDFVHWENFGGQEWNHAEYHGLDGNTRVKFVNWSDYGGDRNMNGNAWNHNPANDSIYKTQIGQGPTHKQECLMMAVGLTSGFAKGANIHYIASENKYDELIKTLNVIKLWDATKPINPKTGRRNRTVVNTSFFLFNTRFSPYSQFTPSTQRISGSIEFNDSFVLGMGGKINALRFEGQKISDESRRDYIFAFRATTSNSTLLDQKINASYNVTANFYSTASSWGEEVANNINNHLNPTSDPLGWTVSIDGNYLHFTSSGTYTQTFVPTNPVNTFQQTYSRYNPIRIYSGSREEFFHFGDSPKYSTNSPRGGGLAFEESSSTAPKTHISKIVVKGNLAYTGSTDPGGSNGYPNSDHSNYLNPPVDDYGINRGINKKISDLNIQLLGISRGIGSEYSQTLSQALKECAEQGIIITQAAGNAAIQQTMESSSLEENPLYDPNLYSDELYNTYVEFDTEFTGWSQGQEDSEFYSLPEDPIPPNTPIRLGNPMWASNYSTIQVGMIMLNHFEGFYNSPENRKTMFDGAYGGDFPNNITKDRIFPQTRKCHGKAISSYAIGGAVVIGGTNSTNTLANPLNVKEGLIAHSSSFYDSITFNTSSITNIDGFNLSGNSSSSFTQGLYSIAESGGTSYSAPLVAGIVCCYLEVNPDASFVDVRNWLHNTGVKEVPGILSNPDKFYHLGRYETSSIHPAYYNDLYLNNGSIDFGGRNPVIAHFPYTSSQRGKLSNIKITRS
tara:strand:- start:3471 stop:6338 length:2868 start_codon:yes stop_codon:yes gene_type:complete